jgi:hypothetical protein
MKQKTYKNKLKFLGIGWKSKVLLKRATYYISISKLVAQGCTLKKGEMLYSYLTEDKNARKIMVVYLDGNEKDNK